jgi:hypothetical protein
MEIGEPLPPIHPYGVPGASLAGSCINPVHPTIEKCILVDSCSFAFSSQSFHARGGGHQARHLTRGIVFVAAGSAYDWTPHRYVRDQRGPTPHEPSMTAAISYSRKSPFTDASVSAIIHPSKTTKTDLHPSLRSNSTCPRIREPDACPRRVISS